LSGKYFDGKFSAVLTSPDAFDSLDELKTGLPSFSN